MKTLQAAFVGFLVSSVALIFIAGGPTYAFLIVGLSIVCTFGAGLLFWVPLWIAVGYTVLLMFKGQRISVRTGGEPDDPDNLEEVYSHPSLIKYITRAKQSEVDENVMIDRLQNIGWNYDEIDDALRYYEKTAKKRPKQKTIP